MNLGDVSSRQSEGEQLSTLSARAFAALREAILAGELAPGTRLEVKALAAQLAMSAMPVREAVRQLDALGLVEHRPHRVARVTELSVDDLREVYAARLILEATAVVAAAKGFDEQHAEQAARSLSRTATAERTANHGESWLADADFHFTLYAAAGSPWLLRVIRPLWESSERYRRLSLSPSRDFRERHAEHMGILEACVARDEVLAAERIGAHLARSANLLSRALGGPALFSESEFAAIPVPHEL